MTIVVLVPLLALAIVALVGLRALNAVQVGGTTYDEIVESQNLVADVLPPPAFLVEAHLSAQELSGTSDPAEVQQRISELSQQETVYYQRLDVWKAVLAEADEQDVLNELIAAYAAGDAFWKVVDERLIPAVQSGDLAAADAIDSTEVNPAFERHKSFIRTVVELGEARRVRLENSAADQVRSEKMLALGAIVGLGLLSLILTALLARSITRPIGRLTSAAAAAERDLPGVVAQVQAGEDVALPAMNLVGTGEFGSLATAMNSMQTTAVGLAAEQARIRRNISTMLGNLARRNQSLVNRTLSFITDLERDERDPETLDNLFKLDHLTTRMRRNAESLLVLSGAEQARSWPRPVEVREVLRAALSEIESFDRVELASLHPALIRGSSVADLTHLVAELLDNATRFSPPDTTVVVTGEQSGDGYTISIVDRGMGMSPEALSAANRDLESLSRLEERTSLVLGFAVVGRLGARNGIGVRLEQSPQDGVTARVRLPGAVLHRAASPAADATRSAIVAGAGTTPSVAMVNGATATNSASNGAAASHAPVNGDSNADAERRGAAAIPDRAPAAVVRQEPSRSPVSDDSTGRSSQRRSAGPFPAPSTPAATPSPTPPAIRRERTDVAAPVSAVANAAPAKAEVTTTTGGLQKRVPGANLFDGALPPPLPIPGNRRSAESVRDALSSFQDGYRRAPRRLIPETETTDGGQEQE